MAQRSYTTTAIARRRRKVQKRITASLRSIRPEVGESQEDSLRHVEIFIKCTVELNTFASIRKELNEAIQKVSCKY